MKIKLSTSDELRQLAFEIIRPLPGGELARVISEDASMICLELPAHSGRLRSVSFSLEALRSLAFDPQRQVKIDYLQRDLLRSAATRESYRYPRQLPKLGRVIRSLFDKKFEKKRTVESKVIACNNSRYEGFRLKIRRFVAKMVEIPSK